MSEGSVPERRATQAIAELRASLSEIPLRIPFLGTQQQPTAADNLTHMLALIEHCLRQISTYLGPPTSWSRQTRQTQQTDWRSEALKCRRIIKALPDCLTPTALREIDMYLAAELCDDDAADEFRELTSRD